MPYIEPSGIDSIPKKEQKRLVPLLRERAFLQCSFSLERLLTAARKAFERKQMLTVEQIQDAVVAASDSDLKKIIKPLNDQIGSILQENGISSLKDVDCFGNPKVYSYYESGGAQISKDKLVEALTKIAKLKPTVIEQVIDAATSRYTYVTLRVADPSKSKNGKEE